MFRARRRSEYTFRWRRSRWRDRVVLEKLSSWRTPTITAPTSFYRVPRVYGRPKNDDDRAECVPPRGRPDRSITATLQVEPAGAGTALAVLRTVELRDCEQQVCGRLLVGHDVAVALQLAVRAAEQQRRRVLSVVEVTVTHAAAEVD